MIADILNEVGTQFANTEGPDFGKLMSLGALVLLEDE